MKFCVIANPEKYSIYPTLNRVVDWCIKQDKILFAAEKLKPYLPEGTADEGVRVLNSESDIIGKADIIIALGGDGTMLHTAHLVKGKNIPVIGINTGKLGFMANIQPDEIEEALNFVSEREYEIDKRYLLQAKTADNNTHYALNEFLFSKKDTSSMITLQVDYDKKLINNYWADGLIISSPTGSTAYNLSAGGPIVQPNTPVMVVTPINPHTLTTRPLILPSGRILTVRTSEPPENILFSYDGIVIPNNGKLDIEIIQSRYSVSLIQLPDHSYFETLRNKLMWGLDRRKV